MSLKKFALECQKEVLTAVPPELFLMKRENIPDYSRIQERDFVGKISSGWIRPAAIDTTYFALHLKEQIGAPVSVYEEERINGFVKSLCTKDGGFLQTNFHERPSIHAIHSAIGIFNILSSHRENGGQVKWDKPMGTVLLQQYLEKDKIDLVKNFLKECKKGNGGFAEDPYGKNPTINATASALWCFWHLEALDEVDCDRTLEFVKQHIVDVKETLGFKNDLVTDLNAWICATYYAFRIFKTIENCRKGSREQIVPQIQKVINLLMECEAKGEKGKAFAATKGFKPTIIHTKDALSLMDDSKYSLGFDKFIKEKGPTNYKKDLIKEIGSFLECCKFNGVYGFAETKYYFPNIYATQLALDIKASLKKMLNQESGESKDLVDEKQKRNIIDFINSCYDKESGGYRGYSHSTAYIPSDWQSLESAA